MMRPIPRRWFYSALAILCVLTGSFCVFMYQSARASNPLEMSTGREDKLATEDSQTPFSDRKMYKRKQYMLALCYAEQLTMSSRHFQTFLNLAAYMNMTGVEPLIHQSRIYGVKSIVNTEWWVSYQTVFDVPAINEGLGHCLRNGTSRVVFEDNEAFFCSSHRKIIYVHVVDRRGHPPRSLVDLWSSTKWDFVNGNILKYHSELGTNTSIIDCTQSARQNGVSTLVEELLNKDLHEHPTCAKHSSSGFEVVQSFCIRGSSVEPLTPGVLKSTLLQSQHIQESSVVFFFWQGSRTVMSFQDRRSNFNKLESCTVWPLPQSPLVKETSTKLLQSNKLNNGSFVSVHVRFERVIEHEQHELNFTYCCMQRLVQLIHQVQGRHNLTRVLVIKDYSAFGTDTCRLSEIWRHVGRNYCRQTTHKAIEILTENIPGIVISDMNPSDYGVPLNSGFVSRVEAESALAGEVLITVGWGSFQATLTKQFLQRHYPNTSQHPQHYHICLGEEILNGFQLELETTLAPTTDSK